MYRRLLSLALLAVAAAVVATPAMASLTILHTLDELTRVSEVVVRGRVFSVDAAWDGGTIYSYVTVDIDEVVRGNPPGDRIVIKQLGGAVGNAMATVSGQAEFDPGEEVVLFLSVRPRDRTLTTAALWQGKWLLQEGPSRGDTVALRHAGRDHDGGLLLHDRLPLDRIMDVARGTAGTMRSGRTDIVFHPPEAPAPVNTVDRIATRAIPLTGFSWHQVYDGKLVKIGFTKVRQPKVGTGKKQIKAVAKAQNKISGTLPVWKKGKKYKGSAVGSDFRGDSLTGPSDCPMDVVVFNGDPKNEVPDDGTLGVAYSIWFTGPTENGHLMACQGAIVMNDGPRADAYNRNKTCYQNVLNHEVMHTGGLGHSNLTGNLMFPSVDVQTCQGGKIPFGNDDKSGWRQLYDDDFAARQ